MPDNGKKKKPSSKKKTTVTKKPTNKQRIDRLKVKRAEILSTPSGGSGAAKTKRMKEVRKYDDAIMKAGGKVEPISAQASKSSFRNKDYVRISKGKRS